MKRLLMTLLCLSLGTMLMAAEDGLVGHWKFDDIRIELMELDMERGEFQLPRELFGFVTNSVDGSEGDYNAKYLKQAKGVSGGAILLDGNTGYVRVSEDDMPRVEGDFSIETWIAIAAYPNNLCPLVGNIREIGEGYHNGYSFDLDSQGRLVFRIATDAREEVLSGKTRIPLYTWTHVAATYSPKTGMKLYINGKSEGSFKPTGTFTPVDYDADLLFGRTRWPSKPFGTIRPYGTTPYHMFYDGLMDEIKIWDKALTGSVVKASYNKNKTTAAPDLQDRTMPTGPLKAEVFAAISTNLKWYESYDALWHTGRGADVVVRFDEYPCEFVFWKGANYQAHLVTERGYWFNNGFNEGWNENGSCEPMSDKQARHSHVKVLEQNEARIVVQWRYALIDHKYGFSFYDPNSKRGDWTNETYFIYPDMVAVREDILYSNAPRAEHEWQESMVVPGPGQRPEDLLEYAALTLGNDKGEMHTYSWEHKTPPGLPQDPPNPNFQLVNMKSKYKPFSILRAQDDPSIDVYAGEIRREVSVFPWWNPWPTAQKPTDGRWSQAADRASHSSISHWFWDHYEMTDRSMTKLMLTGMTDRKAEELLTLGRSWYNAPEMKGEKNMRAEFDQAQRAYQVKIEPDVTDLEFTIHASAESPSINPAFVLKDWTGKDLALTLNGKEVPRGNDFRYGNSLRIDGGDLVVWFKHEGTEPVAVKFTVK